MGFFYNGRIGIDAGHVIQAAVNSKSLGEIQRETPEALKEYYISRGMLKPSASVQDALELKKRLIARDHVEIPRERETKARIKRENEEREAYRRQHNLSYPITSRSLIMSRLEGKSPEEILDALGIQTETLVDGKKELSHYKWAPYNYSFKAVGIDENELIKGVESVKGTFDLTGSNLENLGEIKSVGKLVIPQFSHIKDLSGLKYVGEIEMPDMTKEETAEIVKELNMDPEVISRARIKGIPSYMQLYYQCKR